MQTILKAEKLSKWYGNVLGLSEISLEIGSGITGLLGPNGAGKSTFLKIASGQLKPNLGKIEIYEQPIFNNHRLFKKIGFCSEHDSYYPDITGQEFLLLMARLHHFRGKHAYQAARIALAEVGLEEKATTHIAAYSMGMRQRLKLAASMIHKPDLWILDEPLRGIDPFWRIKIMTLIQKFAEQKKAILISSHILAEIESMTDNIVLIHQGKVFAEGNIHEIRTLLDRHPHKISISCNHHRLLAEKMIPEEYIQKVHIDDSHQTIILETNDRDRFFSQLMQTIVSEQIEISEISSPDDNLQSIFDYLIGR